MSQPEEDEIKIELGDTVQWIADNPKYKYHERIATVIYRDDRYIRLLFTDSSEIVNLDAEDSSGEYDVVEMNILQKTQRHSIVKQKNLHVGDTVTLINYRKSDNPTPTAVVKRIDGKVIYFEVDDGAGGKVEEVIDTKYGIPLGQSFDNFIKIADAPKPTDTLPVVSEESEYDPAEAKVEYEFPVINEEEILEFVDDVGGAGYIFTDEQQVDSFIQEMLAKLTESERQRSAPVYARLAQRLVELKNRYSIFNAEFQKYEYFSRQPGYSRIRHDMENKIFDVNWIIPLIHEKKRVFSNIKSDEFIRQDDAYYLQFVEDQYRKRKEGDYNYGDSPYENFINDMLHSSSAYKDDPNSELDMIQIINNYSPAIFFHGGSFDHTRADNAQEVTGLELHNIMRGDRVRVAGFMTLPEKFINYTALGDGKFTLLEYVNQFDSPYKSFRSVRHIYESNETRVNVEDATKIRKLEVGDTVKITVTDQEAQKKYGEEFRAKIVADNGDTWSVVPVLYKKFSEPFDVSKDTDIVLVDESSSGQMRRDITITHSSGKAMDWNGFVHRVAPSNKSIIGSLRLEKHWLYNLQRLEAVLAPYKIDAGSIPASDFQHIVDILRKNIRNHRRGAPDLKLAPFAQPVKGVAGDSLYRDAIVKSKEIRDFYGNLEQLTHFNRANTVASGSDNGGYYYQYAAVQWWREKTKEMQELVESYKRKKDGDLKKLQELKQREKQLHDEAVRMAKDKFNLAKIYRSRPSLDSDNNKTQIYYDEKLDTTNRLLFNVLRNRNPTLTAEDVDDLARDQIKRDKPHLKPEEIEQELLNARRGGKIIRDGDYALLVTGKHNQLFKREGNVWDMKQNFTDIQNFHDFCLQDGKTLLENSIQGAIGHAPSDDGRICGNNELRLLKNEIRQLEESIMNQKVVDQWNQHSKDTVKHLEDLRLWNENIIERRARYERQVATNNKKLEQYQPVLDENTCEHRYVEDDIKAIDDLPIRYEKLRRFMQHYRRPTVSGDAQTHVYCRVCSKKLICTHYEYITNLFTAGGGDNQLFFEIVEKYGSLEGDRIVCRACGENLFPTSIDPNETFSKSIPQFDRAVLEEAEEKQYIMGGAMYDLVKSLQDNLNLAVTPEMVDEVVKKLEMSTVKGLVLSKDQYEIMGGKASYDVYKAKTLVVVAASYLFLYVQSELEDVMITRPHPKCRVSLAGWPLEEEDNMKGVEYFSCAISVIVSTLWPWNVINPTGSKIGWKENLIMQRIVETIRIIMFQDPDVEILQRYYNKRNQTAMERAGIMKYKWYNFLPNLEFEYDLTEMPSLLTDTVLDRLFKHQLDPKHIYGLRENLNYDLAKYMSIYNEMVAKERPILSKVDTSQESMYLAFSNNGVKETPYSEVGIIYDNEDINTLYDKIVRILMLLEREIYNPPARFSRKLIEGMSEESKKHVMEVDLLEGGKKEDAYYKLFCKIKKNEKVCIALKVGVGNAKEKLVAGGIKYKDGDMMRALMELRLENMLVRPPVQKALTFANYFAGRTEVLRRLMTEVDFTTLENVIRQFVKESAIDINELVNANSRLTDAVAVNIERREVRTAKDRVIDRTKIKEIMDGFTSFKKVNAKVRENHIKQMIHEYFFLPLVQIYYKLNARSSTMKNMIALPKKGTKLAHTHIHRLKQNLEKSYSLQSKILGVIAQSSEITQNVFRERVEMVVFVLRVIGSMTGCESNKFNYGIAAEFIKFLFLTVVNRCVGAPMIKSEFGRVAVNKESENVAKVFADFFGNSLIMFSNRSESLDVSIEDILEAKSKAQSNEAKMIIDRLDKLKSDDALRSSEFYMKQFGLGDWSLGAKKGVQQYSAEHYEREQSERQAFMMSRGIIEISRFDEYGFSQNMSTDYMKTHADYEAAQEENAWVNMNEDEYEEAGYS
jgi:hypothetical protein